MKKFFLMLSLLAFLSTQASVRNIASETPVAPNAANVMIPVGGGHSISLLDLSKIPAADFEKLSGKKMNFFDRLAFKFTQHKLAKGIDADGKINSKKLQKAFSNGDHSRGFHLGGFALGFFVGLIGVLIAYLIKDDNRRNRIKWAWIGVAAWIVIYVALILPAL